jgi:hypothetical protein
MDLTGNLLLLLGVGLYFLKSDALFIESVIEKTMSLYTKRLKIISFEILFLHICICILYLMIKRFIRKISYFDTFGAEVKLNFNKRETH